MTRRRITWLRLEHMSKKCNLNGVMNMIERRKRGALVDTANEHKIFHDLHEAYDYLAQLLKEEQEE